MKSIKNKGDKNITIAVLYADADIKYWDEMERHLGVFSKLHSNVRKLKYSLRSSVLILGRLYFLYLISTD